MILWWLACTPEPEMPVAVAPNGTEVAPNDGRFRRRRVKDRELLETLGYLDGTQAGTHAAGAVVIDAEAISPGNNLYVSGQGPEAYLIDRDGKVLHSWKKDYFEALPNSTWDRAKPFPNNFRRALLLPDGTLFVIWGGQGMARLDKDSNVIWALDEPIHHDLELAPDGNLWTLSRRVEKGRRGRNVLDQIVAVDPATGAVRRRLDVRELILNGPYEALQHRFPSDGDLFHTNTLEWLDGRPPFQEGQLLVSFRHLDTIGVVDLEKEQLVWALTGQWSAQHQPVLLDNGRILLFDNHGRAAASRVLEVDPLTQAVPWQYGYGDGEHFESRILGSVQRLPNGNTLITESNDGHAFEITPDGRRVWSFTVPFAAGSDGQFVASLYELIRLPPDFAFP